MAENHGRDSPVAHNHHAEDWEEWEDDTDIITPIDNGEQVLIQTSNPPNATKQTKSSSLKVSRQSTTRIHRLRSRKRQQAQNAKAGIRLITDMSTLRRQNHIASQMRSPNRKPAKFVDAAALKALEGEPNSASVGNWNWLKKNKNLSPSSAIPKSDRPFDQGLSPLDRPIVIGIALPSDEAEGREISPQTATVHELETPIGFPPKRAMPPPASPVTEVSSLSPDEGPHKSVWSPDTPDTVCSFNSYRPASSVYSHGTPAVGVAASKDAPPVPTVPANFKKMPRQKLISLDLGGGAADDEESGTPCTLFEEDGVSSPQKTAGSKTLTVSPDSAGVRSQGWWDHVVTPFMDRKMSFSSRRPRMESPREEAEDEWSRLNEKKEVQTQRPSIQPTRVLVQPPIVRIPTPRRTPSPRDQNQGESSSQATTVHAALCPNPQGLNILEKPRIIVTEERQSEQPPPYSPLRKPKDDDAVRYRAVFPPGHPLHAQFPPSPRPASPGLAGTMTSQGGAHMTEIPITPAARSYTPSPLQPLPIRPVGTALPESHAYVASGRANRVERERRRHEKEDVMARRVGGFWRGRGCMPSSGCFGRTGREGRKRRRVCMAIWGGAIAVIILIAVLAVFLSRHHASPVPHSIWVNLTDYPPMPTGVLTVVGPDNSVAKSDCTSPSTLWSCSLPKDDHDSVAPYKANQPTVILQIQWDNATARSWKVPNGAIPPSPPAAYVPRSVGPAALVRRIIGKRAVTDGFSPNPSPPSFAEMWFLGDTSDKIVSDEKAGEPTPFFISLLKSVNGTVESSKLARRNQTGQNPVVGNGDGITTPPPDLEADGTPAPAIMLPDPSQQPVRLYDRGLPTEHYGFYTHFKRTIYLKSATVLNSTESNIPLDQDGGCTKGEANFLTTWGETRVLVQIWTQALQAKARLLKPDGSGGIKGSPQLIRPGTMPYPVTVTLDTHGGNPDKKFVWDWPIDKRQKLDLDGRKFLANQMWIGGTWINGRNTGDKKYGGFDGGTGGCKCQWVNWVGE